MSNGKEDVRKWQQGAGGRLPPSEEGKKPEETMEEFWARRQKELEHKVKIEELKGDLDEYQTKKSKKIELPPPSKDEMSFNKFMLELMESERAARRAAEASKTESEKARWETERKRIEDMINDFKEQRAKAIESKEDPYDVYKRFRSMFDDVKSDLMKGIPQNVATAGLDGPAMIQLEQMRQQHEERMAELGHNRDLELQKMKQMHDIAMEEARDRRLELEVKIEQLKRESQSRQQSWSDLVSLGGKAVVAALAGEELGPQVSKRQVKQNQWKGKTAQNIAVYKCEQCGFDIPVSPEVEQAGEKFTCPQCGAQYQIEASAKEDSGSVD